MSSISVSPEVVEEVKQKIQETLDFFNTVFKQYEDGACRSKTHKWKLKSKSKEESIRVFHIPSKYFRHCHAAVCRRMKSHPKISQKAFIDEKNMKQDEIYDGMETLHDFKDSIKFDGLEGNCEVRVTRNKGKLGLGAREFVHLVGSYKTIREEEPELDEESEGEDEKVRKLPKSTLYYTFINSIDWKGYKPSKKAKRTKGTYFPSGAIFYWDRKTQLTVMIAILQCDIGGWVPGFVYRYVGGHVLQLMVRNKRFIEGKRWVPRIDHVQEKELEEMLKTPELFEEEFDRECSDYESDEDES